MLVAWGLAGWSIVAGAALLVWTALTYNAFVTLGNKVNEAFSGVDVQLKRRHDLVPNLVRVVRAYASHERETLEEVVAARNAATVAESVPERSDRETGLARSLGRLIALVERYPELKADGNFRRLQDDLVEVEDHLQYARRYYNGTVRDHNTRIQRFPANLLAGLLGRGARDFFQIEDDTERRAPSVSMEDGR